MILPPLVDSGGGWPGPPVDVTRGEVAGLRPGSPILYITTEVAADDVQ